MRRRGFTLIELIFFLWLLACMVGGATWGGARSAWLVVPGVLGGVLVAIALPVAVLWPLDRFLRWRYPARPRCFAGRCGPDDYRHDHRAGVDAWRCACGDEYVLADDRFLRLLRGEVRLAYMRRDPRGRWVADARAAY